MIGQCSHSFDCQLVGGEWLGGTGDDRVAPEDERECEPRDSSYSVAFHSLLVIMAWLRNAKTGSKSISGTERRCSLNSFGERACPGQLFAFEHRKEKRK